ncbi:uncharacterized protein EDB93DRAFT_513377 [Suillus bovinus]|uniref:uncharacterized protein n=1 Tax=Suillus bovinus TaxID=48563 RepID=UPI001B886D0D|nr:uncharacterized protein EDB93DRAFT_513377 [Suillus bovinus]KAG2145311.1 hypothetical protein EDB93DRAFT_513377 [Suillus bovinus]
MARPATTHFLLTSFLLTSANFMEFEVPTSCACIAFGMVATSRSTKRASIGMWKKCTSRSYIIVTPATNPSPASTISRITRRIARFSSSRWSFRYFTRCRKREPCDGYSTTDGNLSS